MKIENRQFEIFNFLLNVARLAIKARVGMLLVLSLGALTASSVEAAYRFRVEEMQLDVFVNPDASARLRYKIVFGNLGQPIDIVDIGLPHDDYNIGNMSATIDNVVLRDIRRSEYIAVGVEVHLGGQAIPAGKQGTFVFECTMPDMVYKDTTDAARASLQIKPTWFDPTLQEGNTLLKIAVHLPPGVEPEEVTWHDDRLPYDNLVLFGEGDQQHVVATWEFPNLRLSERNPKVGLSFPRRLMDRVVEMSAMQLLVRWFKERPTLRIFVGVALLGLTAFWFLRFSGGTGWVVLLLLAGGLGFVMLVSPALQLIALPVTVGMVALIEYFRGRRGKQYLPAMATIEGGGIKRGLTAPQAALLLELPLSKVLTLVIFGLLKKGVLKVKSEDPLIVEVNEAFRTSRKNRRRAAADHGIVLHTYEHPFLDRLIGWDAAVAERDFGEPVGNMINALAGQMKGFDLSDSQEYYRQIVSRAWKEAESIGELKRQEVVDRNFEWLLLDENYGDRFTAWNRGGYHYHPIWSRHTTAGGGVSSPGVGRGAPQTTLGEVASSFAGWAENTTGSFVSAVEPGSLGIDAPGGGFLDLSGVDSMTADVFQAMAESSSSGGGGGGGGCACACAGCACACACAGGGR